MPDIREIGGRKWRSVDPRSLTLEHDGYFERAIRMAQLDTIKREKGETVEHFMVRIYSATVDSGQVILLLAGLLLPEEIPDHEWTPQRARENAQFLRPLTSTEDKMQMRLALISFLADFFAEGLLSDALFPTAGEMEQLVPGAAKQSASARPS